MGIHRNVVIVGGREWVDVKRIQWGINGNVIKYNRK